MLSQDPNYTKKKKSVKKIEAVKLDATNMERFAKLNCWWPEGRKWRLPLRAFFMGGTRQSSVKRSKAPNSLDSAVHCNNVQCGAF